MQWENVHIFISSTFNDMHAERDYLVKSVFPELSEWCEARRLRLIDIDLRWGVTAADSEAKNTVRACLRNIDECRPFFLCFLGQRRGWVPSADDIGEDTYQLFPNLVGKNYLGDASVTEMEILHALVDPLHSGILRGTKDDSRSGAAVEHAFFYLRDPEYLSTVPHPDLRAVYTNEAEGDPATADNELARWREREIPKTGRPVCSYTTSWLPGESSPEIALPLCVPTTAPQTSEAWKKAFKVWRGKWAAAGVDVGESGEIAGAELEKAQAYNAAFSNGRLGDFQVDGRPLSDVIIEQLKAAIEARYPAHMASDEQTPLQKEIDQQEQFLRLASDGFIERTGDFEALSEYLQNDESRPFAVTAHAGMGKTSLLAHFIDKCQLHGNESLHYRFIGGSDDSVNAERLLRSILSELRQAEKLVSDIPADSGDMMDRLPELLAEAGTNGKTVLVIDALNQLESGMDDLYWIPCALPENVKLIVSFKRGEESADAYYRQQEEDAAMVLHSVRPFDSLADRRALVTAYLEQYFKELDEPRITALIESEGADNPLFLKAALSELRVFGVHNDLSEVIRTRFGNTPVKAFQAILERMENDPAYTSITPAVALPHVLGFLAHSRYGMGVEELAGLLMLENLASSKTAALDCIYLMLRQLRPFLAKRDGRVDFFYESFKIAATERYTGEHQYARKASDWHSSLAKYFETQLLDNRHRLMEQAWQYAMGAMAGDLDNLLWDYSYLDIKIRFKYINQLIDEFSFLGLDAAGADAQAKSDAAVLQSFLQRSEECFTEDPDQLAPRLYATFISSEHSKIQWLLAEAAAAQSKPWLRPTQQCCGFMAKRVLTSKDTGLPQEGHTQYRLHTLGPSTVMLFDGRDRMQLWDTKSFRKIKEVRLQGRVNPQMTSSDIYRLATLDLRLSHSKKSAAICSIDDVSIFDVKNGSRLKTFSFDEANWYYDAVFSSDDKRLLVYAASRLLVQEAPQNNSLYEFSPHLYLLDIETGAVLGHTVLPTVTDKHVNSRWFVMFGATDDEAVIRRHDDIALVDLRTGDVKRSWDRHRSNAALILQAPDRQGFYLGSHDYVNYYSLTDPGLDFLLEDMQGSSLAADDRWTRLFGLHSKGGFVYNLQTRSFEGRLSLQNLDYQRICCSGDTLASFGVSNQLVIYDIAPPYGQEDDSDDVAGIAVLRNSYLTGDGWFQIKPAQVETFSFDCCFSSDGRFGAGGSTIFDLGKCRSNHSAPSSGQSGTEAFIGTSLADDRILHKTDFYRAAISPDDRYCAFFSSMICGSIGLFEFSSESMVSTREFDDSNRMSYPPLLCFYPDNEQLLLIGSDCKITSWSIPDLRCVELWDLQDTMCVARLQSAKWVGGHQLLVQSPHTLHLLDVSTRKLLRTLDIPPDTKVLAAKDNIAVLGGGSPLSLSLWDIEANARLAGFNFDQLYMPTLSEVEFDGSQLRVLYHLPAKNRVYDFSFILEDPAASPPVRALSEPMP